MKQATSIILPLVLCASFIGCSTPQTPDEEYGWGWKIGGAITGAIVTGLFESLLGIDDDDCKTPDAYNSQQARDERLWKRGYGENNPNIERRKQGLPLINLDGTVDKR